MRLRANYPLSLILHERFKVAAVDFLPGVERYLRNVGLANSVGASFVPDYLATWCGVIVTRLVNCRVLLSLVPRYLVCKARISNH